MTATAAAVGLVDVAVDIVTVVLHNTFTFLLFSLLKF